MKSFANVSFQIFPLEALNCDKPDEAGNTEVKLKKKLFCKNYDKEIRPGPSSEGMICMCFEI